MHTSVLPIFTLHSIFISSARLINFLFFSVADPGFDLRGGGRGLCQRVGGGVEKSHISIKIMLKINREQSERRKQ